jgi:hypothetical protein
MLFGLLGAVMVNLGYPRPPFLVGMILLPLTEQNFSTSVLMNRGSYDFLLRPITISILIITVLALAYSTFRQRQRRRTLAVAAAAEQPAISSANLLMADDEPDEERPTTLLDVLFPAGLLALTFVLYAQALDFPPRASLFPRIVLIPLAALLAWVVITTALRWQRLGRPLRPPADGDNVRPTWWIAAWLLALPVLMWAIGVVAGVGVYTTAFLLGFAPTTFSPRRAIWSILGGAIMTYLTYVTFVQTLGIQFHRGLLG